MSQPESEVYTATYSGIQVFEMTVNDLSMMRRRSDSYLNATQILKLGGLEKGKRTKILEREILPSTHEKIQGGYGKYQGTWVPFERGRELAERYNVLELMLPLLDF
ncbi:transcription regulator HTH, apses-type DNA-binding domain-containing protein, partial [Chlamydoabsidia padenii]